MSEIQVSETRQKVVNLQEAMDLLPQVDCPVRHHFTDGVYAREITIPKGTVLVGAVHKRDSIVVLSSGALRLVVDGGTKDIYAPFTMTCKAGAKNAAFAIETAVWTNFFPNPDNEQDTDKLVEILTESKASELLGGSENKQLLQHAQLHALEE